MHASLNPRRGVCPPPSRVDGWVALPVLAAVLAVVLLAGAAVRETPTYDEYAHVPAGALHWKHGQLDVHPYNPPAGKLWLAAPLAADRGVEVPTYDGPGTGWEPWRYGQMFERANADRYLSLMARARLMSIPWVLVTGLIVYWWTRALFGGFAAALSATLVLLSPSVLAHGHLATMDAASMATIATAAAALRWSGLRPESWQRALLAGGALGVALAIKFSALFLAILAPAVWLALAWPAEDRARTLARLAPRLGAYVLAAWLVLNLSAGFSGTFDRVGSLQPNSKLVQTIAQSLPQDMPLLVPRPYVLGVDVLQEETETGQYPGYFRGRWSTSGVPYYYFVVFALKETEPVVVLAGFSLLIFWLARPPWREAVALVAPLAAFLLIVALGSSIHWGVRYVLPAFPFVFVMLGSCFRWFELKVAEGGTQAEQAGHERALARQARTARAWRRRAIVAAAVAGYACWVAIGHYPAYISYFNWFAGGTAGGARWLVGSNFDWGQDLYRLVDLTERYGVKRWKLLYFGNVMPQRYGLDYELADETAADGMFAVSVNFLHEMPCAVLFEGGPPRDIEQRGAWLARLVPTEWAGGLAIFDLRPDAPERLQTAAAYYNAGALALMRGNAAEAMPLLERAIALDAEHADTHLARAMAASALERHQEAVEAYRRVLSLEADQLEALNNLAWYLSVGPEAKLRRPKEAVRLAERAWKASGQNNLAYLTTLIEAYVAANRLSEARAACNTGLKIARAADRNDICQRLQATLAEIEARTIVDSW